MNHLTTLTKRCSGSFWRAIERKSVLFSAQNLQYSVRDTGERMKGGAVREAKSPLKDAMDFKKEVQELG